MYSLTIPRIAVPADGHRDPVRQLKTVRRPPIYPNGAQAISPAAPSPPFRCPHAVHRWIRAKTAECTQRASRAGYGLLDVRNRSGAHWESRSRGAGFVCRGDFSAGLQRPWAGCAVGGHCRARPAAAAHVAPWSVVNQQKWDRSRPERLRIRSAFLVNCGAHNLIWGKTVQDVDETCLACPQAINSRRRETLWEIAWMIDDVIDTTIECAPERRSHAYYRKGER